ncbi:hypothetical protein CspHIS471_0311840 [Cutaneotrichosporon sp. HIS471]|nr:hypothetical protein CspHIS471_0311840 [Cutaneotrichosporon sp. HIS471]
MLYTSTANDDNDINRIMQAALNAMGLESRTATAVTVMYIDGLALYPGSSGYPTATRATANQMARNHTRSSLPIREFQRRQFRGQLQIWDQRRAQLQRLLELTTTTQVSNNSTIYPQPTLILQRQRFELIRRNATRMAAMTQNYNTTQWLHVGKEVTLKVLTMLFNMLLASISYIHRYPARFPNPKRELLSLAQYLDGSLNHFKVKRTTKFHKLKRGYAKYRRIDADSVRLYFDGQPLLDTSTPNDLPDLEDNSVIDHFIEQVGGMSILADATKAWVGAPLL